MFVSGYHETAGTFAGTLDYNAGSGNFSGTIYTENLYSGTADALFSSATSPYYVAADLLPNGYKSIGYVYIDDNDPEVAYDDQLAYNDYNAITPTKAAGVEQLSFESANHYDSGFALAPQNAILNFTITGLTASTDVAVVFTDGYLTNITGSVTTDVSGTATFAIGVANETDLNDFSLTVGGNAITLVSESKTLSAGKIYNINRSAAPAAVTDLSMVDCAGNARAKQWTANCYMVHTAGDYKLPLVYGNAIKDGETNAAAYTGIENANTTLIFPRHDGNAITAPWIKDNGITVASAELLWQDAEGLITKVGIDGDYLTLTVGKDATAQEGNAVIAAKDGDGTVVWSWHIWVTKETFATLTSINTGDHTYQVTPVNLGWVATGGDGKQGYNTFYQWGRKDAFIPSDGTTTGSRTLYTGANHTVYDISGNTVTGFTYSNTSVAIADNIKNPTTQYYNSDNNGPCTTTYYNMWDAQNTATDNVTSATKKTVYDPCPPGFCVPTGNLYSYANDQGGSTTWDGTNKGRTWQGIFFPASGSRSRTPNLVRRSGYYWSASPNNGNNGRYLFFGSDNWGWSGSSRAGGYSVRAVAEE